MRGERREEAALRSLGLEISGDLMGRNGEKGGEKTRRGERRGNRAEAGTPGFLPDECKEDGNEQPRARAGSDRGEVTPNPSAVGSPLLFDGCFFRQESKRRLRGAG